MYIANRYGRIAFWLAAVLCLWFTADAAFAGVGSKQAAPALPWWLPVFAVGFLGSIVKGIGKVAGGILGTAVKVAPIAAMVIPGVGPIAAAGIGALSSLAKGGSAATSVPAGGGAATVTTYTKAGATVTTVAPQQAGFMGFLQGKRFGVPTWLLLGGGLGLGWWLSRKRR